MGRPVEHSPRSRSALGGRPRAAALGGALWEAPPARTQHIIPIICPPGEATKRRQKEEHERQTATLAYLETHGARPERRRAKDQRDGGGDEPAAPRKKSKKKQKKKKKKRKKKQGGKKKAD